MTLSLQEVGLIVSITGGLTALIARPAYAKYKKWREKNPPFRKTMLRTMEQLEIKLNALEDKASANADVLSRLENTAASNTEYAEAMLRERLESAYTVYAIRMGWCPSGEKRMLMDLFRLHESRGWNHINKKYRDVISNLPESESERKKES